MFDLIAFDADDTLWQSEIAYHQGMQRLKEILAPYHPEQDSDQALLQTELRNLVMYGYGLKSFTLSALETAIQLSQGRITGEELNGLLENARHWLQAEVELLPHVAQTLKLLAPDYPLLVLTKGDLNHQEDKLRRSGIDQYFRYIEIVSDKTSATYKGLFERYQLKPERFLMVGNSLRSDILPVVELGGKAVFIPHPLTWAHEHRSVPMEVQERFWTIEHIGLLPELLKKIA